MFIMILKLNKNKYCPGFHICIFRMSFLIIVIITASFCRTSTDKTIVSDQSKMMMSDSDSSLISISDSNLNKAIIPNELIKKSIYNLDNPDATYILPQYLEEISGLAFYSEERILCIQDEAANIYVLNLEDGKIADKYDFGKSGDYEGITLVGQTAYVLRSDGHIFEVRNFDKKSINTKEHNTPLSGKNDAEGIAYDKSSNSLLIACKGSPEVEKDKPYKGYKAIYKYDLGEMKLKKKPDLLIDLEKSDTYQDTDLFKELSLRSARQNQFKQRLANFQPSGIALHPVTDEFYIISGVTKILVVLNRQGKIIDVQELNLRIFRQPEGICFSPAGDLFISNEGQGGAGYIVKFNQLTDK